MTCATIVALLMEYVAEGSGATALESVLRILLGIALVVWAVVILARRPRPGDRPDAPGWVRSFESATPLRAAGLSAAISVANVKELAFGVGAGLTLGAAHLAPGATIGIALAYAAIACLAIIGIVVAFLVAETRVVGSLEAALHWLVDNNKILVAVVLLVIGAVLIGEGIAAL